MCSENVNIFLPEPVQTWGYGAQGRTQVQRIYLIAINPWSMPKSELEREKNKQHQEKNANIFKK